MARAHEVGKMSVTYQGCARVRRLETRAGGLRIWIGQSGGLGGRRSDQEMLELSGISRFKETRSGQSLSTDSVEEARRRKFGSGSQRKDLAEGE